MSRTPNEHQDSAVREGDVLIGIGAQFASTDARRNSDNSPRRASASMTMGLSQADPARSWTRAGLLQPLSFAPSAASIHTHTSGTSYLSPTNTNSNTQNNGSGGSALSPDTLGGPDFLSDIESFSFSRSPGDIRANTVQLSAMLAVPPLPLPAHYFVSAGPASFPPPSPLWLNPAEGSAPQMHPHQQTHLGPQELRTPLTAADLARIARSSAYNSSLHDYGLWNPYARGLAPVRGRLSLNQLAEDDAVSSHTSQLTHETNEVLNPISASPENSAEVSTPFAASPSTTPNAHASSSAPSGLSLLLAQKRSGRERVHDPNANQNKASASVFIESASSDSLVSDPSSTKTEFAVPDSRLREGARVQNQNVSATERTPLLSNPEDLERGRCLSRSSSLRSSSFSPPSCFSPATPSQPRQKWWPRFHPFSGTENELGMCPNKSKGNDKGGSLLSFSYASLAKRVRAMASKKAAATVGSMILRSIPAVLLGVLLNILDGVSYGMIMFPSNDVFTNFGGIGVSMFFVTVIISQLVYSFGGSGFAGANGSMMIEVVPFFHILASEITRELGEENAPQIISTTIAAFALSSILTGLSFFLLGYLRLGVIIGFFPRHILVGCIGGVGVFLIQTGLAVCARIDDDDFTYTLSTLKFFLGTSHILTLWLPAFALAVLLRLITHKFHHQLIFPVYFLVIPAIFYTVVAAAHIDMPTLRHEGWVFDMGGSSESWYKFYSYFSYKNTSFHALWVTMPTQFALLFFNILHPPLNVPALAVSLNEDVDTNKELVAHGYSNLLAGLFGVVPNYLVYVNTLLFYRVGGRTRLSGLLLALATILLLVVGTAPIGYIPIMLVGALIFVLGIDLVKEALWDTRQRVNRTEYLTIISIMVCMSLWDFVIGVLFGIVVCCFFFVVQNSRRRSIRAMFTGVSAMSAVRRPSAHRDYIRQVAKQTIVLRLQGFLFFGTITQVEEAIRNLLEFPNWQRNPVRFLVIDLTLVAGVDMSSAEAFVRIQRLLSVRSITMVLCGLSEESSIGKSLQNVGLLAEDSVELFYNFSDAMEWTENAYLRAWFMSRKGEVDPVRGAIALPGRLRHPAFDMGEPFHNSPRRNEIHAAAGRTLGIDLPTHADSIDDSDVFIAFSKAFSSYGQLDRERCQPLLDSFVRIAATNGTVLWEQGDEPDGLYLIETGVLRAIYSFSDRHDTFEESMVGGTLAGELSALSSLPRNSQVIVEKDAVLWKLGVEEMAKLEAGHPELSRTFVHLVLKVAKTDYDILLSALAARQ